MESQIPSKIFRVKYEDKTFPFDFPLNQTIEKLIFEAPSLFGCKEKGIYVFHIDGKEQNRELLLADIHLESDQVLELVKKTESLEDIAKFKVINGTDNFTCSGSLFRPIGEVLQKHFDAQGLDLSYYQLQIQGKKIDKRRILGDLKNLKYMVVELVRKNSFPNESRQDQPCDEEEKREESDISSIKNMNSNFDFSTNSHATINNLENELVQRQYPAEVCHQAFLGNNIEPDDEKLLNLQFNSFNISIQIETESIVPIHRDPQDYQLGENTARNLNQKFKLQDETQESIYIRSDQIPKQKIEINKQKNQSSIQEEVKLKEVYIFQYQELTEEKEFAINENISTVLLSLKKCFKVSEGVEIGLFYNDTLMDQNKCLNDYSLEQKSFIMLQELLKQPALNQKHLLLQGEEDNVSPKNKSSMMSLKQEARKPQGTLTSLFYSLKGYSILHPLQWLKSKPKLIRDSDSKLTNEIKIFIRFKNQKIPRFDLDVCLNSRILEIKREIQGKFDIQELSMFLDSIELEDDKFLSQYLQNEGDITVEIRESFRKDTKFDITCNKLPEAQKHSVSKLESESSTELIIESSKDFKPNLQIVVFIDDEPKDICGNQLQTVGDLKQNLRKYIDDVSQQILILLDGQKWVKRLASDQEKIKGFARKGEAVIQILCKTKKIYWIQVGIQNNLKIFQGILHSSFEELMRLVEIDFQIPVRNQLWALKKSRVFISLNEETFPEDLEKNGYSQTNPIRIFRRINLSVCLRDKFEVLEEISTYETIREQKDKIAKRLSISRQSQRWYDGEKELEDEKILEKCFEKKTGSVDSSEIESFALDLIVFTDLEYFAFTSKRCINPDLFKNFFRESEEDLDRIVDSVNFSKTEDSLQFQDKILGLLFAALKRHSLWEGPVSRIKKKMFDRKAMNLWESNEKNTDNQSKFNTQFLLYYFLNSGIPELNIEILKIMKMHFPVPLTINTWSNRFCIESYRFVDELYWTVQKGYFISSFGYGQTENHPCGKTQLNNNLLSSNFALSTERNPICQGCPEVLFDIYKNDKFPINIIDIPIETDVNITDKILSCTNMFIIHSFAEEEKTHKFLKTLPDGIPIIVLYRDIQDAFDNTSKFKKGVEEGFKNALKDRRFEIKIPDFPNYSKSNELIYVAEKVHEFILENFRQLNSENELWRFCKFFEKQDHKINEIFDKIREKSSQIVKAVPIFTELKKKQREQMVDTCDHFKDIGVQGGLERISLSEELQEVLKLLKSENASLFLEKFQDYLRMMKNQQTLDFYKLYEFKSKLSGGPEDAHKKIITEFDKYWEKVKNHEASYQRRQINIDSASNEEVYEFIDDCIKIFEQKILPNIFSIELFWRELIYYEDLQRRFEHQILPVPSVFSSTQLINLKRENILKGFPFEIIDGDLLHMPKEFLKNVFKGMTDRVIVISILGPQSSGKSTLVNFLFGCNFVTSSGRCTKGIYGTYFKVSNFNSCDGILVLDTEGLFGLFNKNEDQHRDKLDRKLVLFCLAISDFVFINFKGDIDGTLTEVLMACKDSLGTLQQGNILIPEIFLILNQNSQTNRETQWQDIDKMGEFGFLRKNFWILPLAYDTEKIKISTIEKYMELSTKKTPKEDFAEKCQSIVQILFEKISSNGNKNVQRTLGNIIDSMEHLWELLGKYSDLLRHSSLQDQVQENKIKEWIEKKVDEDFKKRLTGMANALKSCDKIKLDWEKEFHENFTEEQKLVKLAFESEFKENTEKHLFEDLESLLYTHIDRIRIELQIELNIQSHQEKIKVYDAQGLELIREAAYQLRHVGSFTTEELEQHFEKIWQQYIDKSENFYDRKKEAEKLFETVIERYRTNINRISSSCLPDSKPPLRDDQSFESYTQTLNEKLIQTEKDQKHFEYTKQPPALVFKGGKSSITFRYFDLRQYFTKKQVNETLGISKIQIWRILDLPKIRNSILQLPYFKDEQDKMIKSLIQRIHSDLVSCGITIPYSILDRSLRYELRYSVIQFFTEPVKDEDLNSKNICFDMKSDIDPQFDYVDREQIFTLKNDKYRNRITRKAFIRFTLKNCIKWNKVKTEIEKQNIEIFKKVSCPNIVAEIEADLAKIHLQFQDLKNNLHYICNWEAEKIKNFIKGKIIGLRNLKEHSVQWLPSLSFKYLKKDSIEKFLQSVESNDSSFLIIQNLVGEKWVLKQDFNIPWLDSYAREDLNAVYQNTIEDSALATFVFDQFRFKDLIRDIFSACISRMKKINNLNSMQLYQEIARETNDFIGRANNDLQQVSYRLDFKLVGEIHLRMVHLIWRYFEERYWKKITKPLEDMKNRKEQQKSFFKSLASSDDKQINKAEAEKTNAQIEECIKNLVQILKDDILKAAVGNFKMQNKRNKIQEQLDSKYFSRSPLVAPGELYLYVLNPYYVISEAYKANSKSFHQDLKAQIQGKNTFLHNILSEFKRRIIKVKGQLLQYNEDFWALNNIFEFKKVQIESKDEVLIKKYNSKIGEFYYKIVLAILKGDVSTIFEEYEIAPELKVVMRKIDHFEIAPFESKEVFEILEKLGKQSGNVTNALIFIENLLENMEKLKSLSETLLNFSDENLKEFNDKTNIFVCKQKCPCCDRICGEEDPNHKTHRAIYGHQIRAIGGIIIESTNEASVIRCEDLRDTDQMRYDGKDMNWAQFQDLMKNDPNNPWSFDDALKTRNDKFLKEKFEFVWTVIGEKICKEKYKDLNMKYVHFNQAIIDAQKMKTPKSKNYIIMVDSSQSMSGDRWAELKLSLKETLGKISSMNQDNLVSIINFSSSVQLAYEDTPANSISVDVLNFIGRGTSFCKAFAAGFKLLKKEKKKDIVLIFMTDGEADYPTDKINAIQEYRRSEEFTKLGIKFSFHAIGFKREPQKDLSNSLWSRIFHSNPVCEDVLDRLVKDLEGTTYFVDTGVDLTKAYIEIINKKD